jgi:hypothetical protein
MTQRRIRGHVELDFRPSLELIGSVRRFVTDVYDQLLEDRNEASRIGVATHELLENSVRCSADGCVMLRIEVDTDDPAAVVLVTRNRARPDDLASLTSLVRAMDAAGDPMLHYTMLMRANAKRTDGSGLGLARIRAECEFDVAVALEGDVVTVRASGRTQGSKLS